MDITSTTICSYGGATIKIDKVLPHDLNHAMKCAAYTPERFKYWFIKVTAFGFNIFYEEGLPEDILNKFNSLGDPDDISLLLTEMDKLNERLRA